MSKRRKQRRPAGQSETVTKEPAAPRRGKPAPASVKSTRKDKIRIERTPETLFFGPQTYKLLGIGFAVIVLGFLMMLGGRGDDPAVFDEDIIYSFRKVTLAPILILAGLAVVIYGIFKK